METWYAENIRYKYDDETGLDIFSLGASIVEVAMTPGDPLAWAGLAGDVADADVLIPCVGGIEETLYANGYNYVGKGGFKRAITSAKLHQTEKAPVISISWKSAPDSRTAFIDEYLMQKKVGVLLKNKYAKTYNKIWSPGCRYYEGYTLTPAQRKRRKRR